jgi:hypothetical protein
MVDVEVGQYGGCRARALRDRYALVRSRTGNVATQDIPGRVQLSEFVLLIEEEIVLSDTPAFSENSNR